MMSIDHEYDYFWQAIAGAAGDLLGGIGGGIGQARAGKHTADAAKDLAKADISKAYYTNIAAGEDRAKSVGLTNQAIIGSYAARQSSKDDAKKAKEKKYMYIGIAAAVMLGLGVALYFFLNKPKPAAA